MFSPKILTIQGFNPKNLIGKPLIGRSELKQMQQITYPQNITVSN